MFSSWRRLGLARWSAERFAVRRHSCFTLSTSLARWRCLQKVLQRASLSDESDPQSLKILIKFHPQSHPRLLGNQPLTDDTQPGLGGRWHFFCFLLRFEHYAAPSSAGQVKTFALWGFTSPISLRYKTWCGWDEIEVDSQKHSDQASTPISTRSDHQTFI